MLVKEIVFDILFLVGFTIPLFYALSSYPINF